MRYMLDTNIISDLIKNPFGKTAEYIRQFEQNSVCTSVIAAGELQYGAEKKASAHLSNRIDKILTEIPILSLEPEVSVIYGKLRVKLERKGLPIGSNDLWIAAHALTEDKILVTHNLREFERIEDLKVESWLD